MGGEVRRDLESTKWEKKMQSEEQNEAEIEEHKWVHKSVWEHVLPADQSPANVTVQPAVHSVCP